MCGPALTLYDSRSSIAFDSRSRYGAAPLQTPPMSKKDHELGEAELETLKVLWDHGPATVRDVLDRLHEQGRRVAYTTVLTFLTRLEQKGYVSSNKSGLAYIYKPRVSRERVTKARLSSVVDQLFDGAASSMVLQLMQSERFSPEELAEFRRLIDRLGSKDEPKGKK